VHAPPRSEAESPRATVENNFRYFSVVLLFWRSGGAEAWHFAGGSTKMHEGDQTKITRKEKKNRASLLVSVHSGAEAHRSIVTAAQESWQEKAAAATLLVVAQEAWAPCQAVAAGKLLP
jgi:hypothetical protein